MISERPRMKSEELVSAVASTVRRREPESLERAQFDRLKSSLHVQLVQALEISAAGELGSDRFVRELRPLAEAFCRRAAPQLPRADLTLMVDELMHEIVGLGPLEPLLEDATISDILVNGHAQVFIERRGRLERTEIRFMDDEHLLRTIQRIVSRVGRRVDESSPMIDARLPDGSRVNAIIPPLSLSGPKLSIRRFGARPLELDDLIAMQSLLPAMAAFLRAAVEARVSFLIAGGTGAGRTTLLGAMSAFIPHDERLVTIEDSAELRLQHPHVVSLEARPANSEGSGSVPPRELLRNSLRMRPDRIIVGEVRGPEAMDMLQAMNTGHEGSLTTIHANDVPDALARLEMMVAMAGFELTVPVVRQYIATGIKLVVHVSRLKGGARRVTRISEIVGIEQGEFRLEDIFRFEQSGVDADGAAQGEFLTTGYQPVCLRRFQAAGVAFDASAMLASQRQPVGTRDSLPTTEPPAPQSSLAAQLEQPAAVDRQAGEPLPIDELLRYDAIMASMDTE